MKNEEEEEDFTFLRSLFRGGGGVSQLGRGFANALLGERNILKMSVPPLSNFLSASKRGAP